MELRKIQKPKGLYLDIVESYRKTDGKPSKRTIQTIGYLKDAGHDIAYYEEMVRKMNEEKAQAKHINILIDLNEELDIDDHLFNVGYFALKEIYKELELDKFFQAINKKMKIGYSLNKNMELLAFSRILYPGSKKSTYENRDIFFEGFDKGITKDSIYDCLTVFAKYKEKIEKLIFAKTKDKYQRDTSTTYYDCTNYYFEIEANDEDELDEEGNIIRKGLRKRGPEKNKRPDPIVEMGLLMDGTGLPLAYDVFPGNESEKISLRPIVKRTKRDYEIARTTVVADRGLNTSDNIFYLAGRNDDADHKLDGYVYGQSVRGASKEFKDWVLDKKDYKVDIIEDDGEKIAFTHKSRVIAKEIKIEKDGKRKVKVNVCQKQMVYFSFKYMMKQRRDRQKMIEKAEDIVKRPQAYTKATSYGAAYYIDDIAFDKETGEVKTDKVLAVNYDKVKEEEKYDGYYAIVTSEIEYDDYKIRDIYRGLAKIEETFKVTKSYLAARPAFVWTYEHIQGHFLTCFVALVIARLLEKKLDERYSIPKIIEALKSYACIHLEANLYRFIYYDEVIEAIDELYHYNLKQKYKVRQDIKKILHYK